MKDKKVEFIRVSKKSNPIEYRPHAQHKLFKQDDRFDFQFSAYLNCQGKLDDTKRVLFQETFRKVINELIEMLSNHSKSGKATLKLIHLQSEVSILDCSYFSSHLVSKINVSLTNRTFITVKIDDENTTFPLIVSNIASYISTISNFSPATRLNPNSIEYTILERNHLWKPEAYLTQIMELLQDYQATQHNDSTILTLCVVLPNIENLAHSTLAQLVEYFNGQCWKTVLVLLGKEMTMAKLLWNDELNFSMSLSKITLPSGRLLYDSTIDILFSNYDFPVQCGPAVLQSLHDDFQNYHCCISTLFQRVGSLLTLHFREAKALWCMYKEWDWLQNINIYSRRYMDKGPMSSMIQSSQPSSVAKTLVLALPSLGQFINLLECFSIIRPVFPNIVLKSNADPTLLRIFEVMLSAYWNKQHVNKLVYKVFQILRDNIFLVDQKSAYSNMQLFIAISYNDDTHFPDVINPLMKLIDSQLRVVSFHRACQTVVKLKQEILQYKAYFLPIEINAEFPLAKSVHKDWNDAPVWYSKLVDSIEDLSIIFESIKDDVFGEEYRYLQNMSFRKMSTLSKDEHQKLYENPINSESTSTNNNNAESNAKFGIDLYEGTLLDTMKWLQMLLDGYRKLYPIDRHFQDVCVIHKTSYDSAGSGSSLLGNENFRKRFMEGLRAPTGHTIVRSANNTNSSNLVPGVKFLADRVQHANMQETANSWFDTFSEGWKEAHPQTKRPLSTIQNEEEESASKPKKQPERAPAFLKCEFAHALYDLEKSGMVLSKGTSDPNAVVISKRMHTGI